MEKVREVRGITPILQNMLIKQIGKILDALDIANNLKAWFSIRSLVLASPPKVKKACVKDLEEIEVEIRKVMSFRCIDAMFTQNRQNSQLTGLMRQRIIPLFEKVMQQLYEGQYLESYREYMRGKEIGY